MNRFHKSRGRLRYLRVLLPALLFCVMLLLLLEGLSSVSSAAAREEALRLRETVLQDAVQCYALEGFYPDEDKKPFSCRNAYRSSDSEDTKPKRFRLILEYSSEMDHIGSICSTSPTKIACLARLKDGIASSGDTCPDSSTISKSIAS